MSSKFINFLVTPGPMKVDLEKILLLGFFVLMLWLGIGTLWDHNLNHNFPVGYSAADAYQHQVRAEWITQQGNYAKEAPEIVAGNTDVIGYYMPGGFHLAAIVSHTAGLASYDALYVMVFLAALMSVFVMYFAVRSYNKHVALLSLPVTTLIFTGTFYFGVLIGQWPFIFGSLFLVGSFWALTKIKLPKAVWAIALFVSAVALTHTSELVFVVLLVASVFLLALRHKDWNGIKTLIAAGVITGIVSVYYLIIFGFTWGKQFGYQFYVAGLNQGFPSVRAFEDFQVLILMFMAAGLAGLYFRNTVIAFITGIVFVAAVKLLDLPSKITSDFAVVSVYFLMVGLFVVVLWIRKPELAKVFPGFMILIGYSSFIGFGPRAFQTRFMWPVTMAPLFGLAVYKLITLVGPYVKIKWGIRHTMGLAILLIFVIIGTNYEGITTPGTMYQERWDMFQWLRGETPEDAKVFFFYGDGYYQTSILYNSGRQNYIVQLEGYIEGLNSQTIKRDYPISLNIDYGPGLPYRTGIFEFGYHLQEDDYTKYDKDVCLFDYYIFDKVTGSQQYRPLIQYNLAIRQTFIDFGMEEVFSNQAVSVLRNNEPGGDCVA